MMSKRDALRSYRRAYKRAYDKRRNPRVRVGGSFAVDHFSEDFEEMGRRGDRLYLLIGDAETEPYGAALRTLDVRALQEDDRSTKLSWWRENKRRTL